MRLRLFVSSPGDVGEERRLTQGVIDRLRFEWSGRVELLPIFWEHEPLRATASFQAEIPRPSEADVVICILWSRLGTRLPEDLTREDGSHYDSGTEFELEDAARSFRENGSPDLLVYRKTAQAVTELDSEEQVMERLEQKKALDGFIDRWFRDVEGSFTAAFHNFAAPARFEELLHGHLDRLIEARLEKAPADAAGERPTPLWDQGSPFRGLESFGPEHAPIFCGRTAEVADVLNLLRRQNAVGKPFLLVLGPSGCGKSSLVRAGVVPGLTEPNVIEGIGLWRTATFVPGTSPGDLLTGLAAALLDEAALGGELRRVGLDVPQLAARLRDEPGTALPLIRSALAQAAHTTQLREELPSEPEVRLALIIDQLEELFTIERFTAADRARFDVALGTLVRSGVVWAIATLRSDFYAQCTELKELTALKEGSGHYDLHLPGAAEIAQMIRQPARIAGLEFEEDARSGERLDDVLRDASVADPEALPLLEFTLDELYKRRDENGRLTLAAYRGLGGVEGALASRAEEVYARLSPAAQGRLDTVLAAVVAVSTDGNLSRRRASRVAITAAPEARELVDAFIDQRLLVTDRGEDGTAVVSVAHEALLRRWPRAQQWLLANQELLASGARIKSATALWQQENRDEGYLLPPGDLLASAQAIAGGGTIPLSPEELSFIEASQAAVARHGRRQSRRLVAAAGVLALLAAAVYVALYLFVFAHVEHYHGFVRRWGEPVGVGKLGRGDRARRQATLEFHRRGRLGPVHEARAVNSDGRLTALHSVGQYLNSPPEERDIASPFRACNWKFEYRGRELTRETGLNCYGENLYEFLYTETSPDGLTAKAQYIDEGIAQPQAESGAAVVAVTRNAKGLERRIEFSSVRGEPRSDPTGSYGIAVEEFHRSGQPKSLMNLGWGGAPAVHRDGYVRVIFEYDDSDRISRLRFLDAANKRMLNRWGYAEARLSYDRRGNLVRSDMLDEHGDPRAGVAAELYEYDDNGNQTLWSLRDAADLPTAHGQGFYAISSEYDDNGDLTSWVFRDRNGDPMTLSNGVARVRREYLDEPTEGSWLSFGQRRKKNRPLSAWAFFDPMDRPTHRGDGVARIEFTTDGRGNFVEETFKDERGELFSPLHLGYATIRRAYDGNRLIRETYHDAAGQATRSVEGVFGKVFEYDTDGHRTRAINVDTTGQRMLDSRGRAEVRWGYGEDRAYVLESYLDAREESVAADGFATQWLFYDAQGNISEVLFFDIDAKPTPVDGWVTLRSKDTEPPGHWSGNFARQVDVPGCHRIAFEYDHQGQQTQLTCLDPQDNPVEGTRRYAAVRDHYDVFGRHVGRSFLDRNDRAITPTSSPSRIRWRLDHLGLRVEERYLDSAGSPTLHPNGWATVRWEYDETGHRTAEWRLDQDGEPTGGAASRFELDYSVPGRVTVMARDESGTVIRSESIERPEDRDLTWETVKASSTYRGTKKPAPRTATRQPPAALTDPPPAKVAAIPQPEPPPQATAPPPATPPPAEPSRPIAPAAGELSGIVDSLYRLSEEILDTHEDVDRLSDDGPLYASLERFYEGAEEMRTAYRRVTGQTLGQRTGIRFRKRSPAEQKRALGARIAELRNLADEVERAARSEPFGPAGAREWRQLRSYLARIEADL